MPERQRSRIRLLQGALTYRDRRIEGFDAAALVEVIEHIEPDRLPSFERVLFEFAKPATVVITTPNREYNAKFEGMQPGAMRHADHRFEWTREEFRAWADPVAQRFGYRVRISRHRRGRRRTWPSIADGGVRAGRHEDRHPRFLPGRADRHLRLGQVDVRAQALRRPR